MIYAVFRLFGRPPKKALTALAVILPFYAAMTGFAPGVVRASITALVFLFSLRTGRRFDALNALSLSAIIILLIWPWALFDLSFQMSNFGPLMFRRGAVGVGKRDVVGSDDFRFRHLRGLFPACESDSRALRFPDIFPCRSHGVPFHFYSVYGILIDSDRIPYSGFYTFLRSGFGVARSRCRGQNAFCRIRCMELRLGVRVRRKLVE